MKEKFKEQKGVTLIALVISIILMLILALVSVNIIKNQEIIEKTNYAVYKFNEDATREQENLLALEEQIKQQSLNNNNNGSKTWWETTDEEKQQINEARGTVAWNGEGSRAGGRMCMTAEGYICMYFIEEDVSQYYLFAYDDTGISFLKSFYEYDNYEKYKWYNFRIDYLQMASGSNIFLEGIYTGTAPVKKDEFTIIYCEDYLDRILSSFNK